MTDFPKQPPSADPQLVPFVKLADPATYRACTLDLVNDPHARKYWVDFFCSHIKTILGLGVDVGVARGGDRTELEERAEACRQAFVEEFDAFVAAPDQFGEVTILTLDMWRDRILRRFNFVDPFVDQKARENEKMLPFVPKVVADLDELSGRDELLAAVRGVFAGNIFDMGAKATAAQFLTSSPDFFQTRDRLKPRPWRIDDLDAFIDRFETKPYRHVVFFVDNAGSDFLLGAVPMMRVLAKRGARVILTANERPTLNDMTVHDVRAIWGRVVEVAKLEDLPIEIVTSGTGEPLIDLRGVAPTLNDAASDADLVILEGMGRGVESNLDAHLTCDRLNLAMIKDELIAKRIGGELYDCVCRFVPAA